MDKVSDDELDALFVFYKPFNGSIAKHLELALTELRERRAAEKAPCPERAKMVAEPGWVDMDCPKCHHAMVAIDQFGLRCMMDGCGWTRDVPVNRD